MKAMRILAVVAFWCLPILGIAQGQRVDRHGVDWHANPQVHLDSLGGQYSLTGGYSAAPGAEVLHVATYPLEGGMPSGTPEITGLEYADAPFSAVGLPRWLYTPTAPQATVVSARDRQYVEVRIPAFRLRGGILQILREYRVDWPSACGEVASLRTPGNYAGAAHSVLARGHWVKIAVTDGGVYQISYEDIVDQGLSNPSNLSVWGHAQPQLPYSNDAPNTDDLRQLPVHWVTRSGTSVGPGDYALVYLPGVSWWEWDAKSQMYTMQRSEYDSQAHYFITTDSQPAHVLAAGVHSASHTQSDYWALAGYIGDEVNLASSGREWFSSAFRLSGERELDTRIGNCPAGAEIKIYARVAAASRAASQFQLSVSDTPIGTISTSAIAAGQSYLVLATTGEGRFTLTHPGGDVKVRMAYQPQGGSGTAWLSRFFVNARVPLTWQQEPLLFHTDSIGPLGDYAALSIAGVPAEAELWDATDIFAPTRYTSPATATVPAAERRRMLLFNPATRPRVTFLGGVENQDLHGLQPPDLLVVAHPDFLSQAERVAQVYRESPLTHLAVEVVTTPQVYNEFSSGNTDVTAIRNLARMLYWRGGGATGRFQHLLLVGKPSFGMGSSQTGTNYLPNYQSYNSYDKSLSFGTDDFFGLLDPGEGGEHGAMDIGVGRYSVESELEADMVVAHEEAYHNPANWGDWMGRLLFLADDGSENSFVENSDRLAKYVETHRPAMQCTRLFADAHPRQQSYPESSYPSVNAELHARIDQGTFLFNYIGHAGHQLGNESYLDIKGAREWKNRRCLPLFVAASCSLAEYDLPIERSLGENMLHLPNGGAIALISASRVSFSSGNYSFNSNLIAQLFPPTTDPTPTSLGTAYYKAKALTSGLENKRKYVMLGNPALPIPDMAATVRILSLNGKAPLGITDTIRAGDHVSLEVELKDRKGELFGGDVYLQLAGPMRKTRTLGNNGNPPYEYEIRSGTAFRGRLTATGGKAKAEWIVPLDMETDYGQGMLQFTGVNGQEVCLSAYQDFTFGGRSKRANTDHTPPEIQLTLEDYAPRERWVVNDNPLLIARLADSSGINSSGATAAHALIATLKGPEKVEEVRLDDYYVASTNTYRKGEIRYRFSHLAPGNYTLTLKAWDTYNNGAEASITFEVVEEEAPRVSHLLNYPNPFTNGTDIYFDGTHAGQPTEVSIQIFTLDGELVRTIRRYESSPGYRYGPYHWDGRDEWGRALGRGVYFYRVRVGHRAAFFHKASSAEGYERMLKL